MTIPRRTIFFALFPFACGYFLSYLLRAVNAVVAPDLVQDFGVSPAELGVLTSAYLLSFSLFQLPLGVFLDRYGARRVQTVLLAIAAAGCFLFAVAPDFLSLVASRAIIGLGFSAGLMASFKASSIWVPIERRSLANACIMSAGALGIIMATEPTAYLVTQVGWRATFTIFGGIILAGAAFVFLAVPEKDEAKITAGLGRQVGELIQILKLPLFWRIAPMLALTAGTAIALQTLWAGPWFRDVLGQAPPEVARSLFWMAAAFMVGIFIVGVVADRLQRRGIGPMTVLLGLRHRQPCGPGRHCLAGEAAGISRLVRCVGCGPGRHSGLSVVCPARRRRPCRPLQRHHQLRHVPGGLCRPGLRRRGDRLVPAKCRRL